LLLNEIKLYEQTDLALQRFFAAPTALPTCPRLREVKNRIAAKPSGRMPQKQAPPNQAKMEIMLSIIVSSLKVAGYS
jgi:hypothetical protein